MATKKKKNYQISSDNKIKNLGKATWHGILSNTISQNVPNKKNQKLKKKKNLF